jgi:uncharacterized UBP type Zn finger protein
MTKRCVYCNEEVSDECAIDVCDKCGVGTWGQKMFSAIKKQMNDAKANDDLCSTNMNFDKEFKGNGFKHV